MRHLATSIAAGLLLWAGPAASHAFLKTAIPGVGSTVPRPPAQVEIVFTQGVEPDFSSITVQDAAGTRVDDGRAHAGEDPTRLAVSLKPLVAGTYRVTWHATSVDTHKTEGSFSFTVAP